METDLKKSAWEQELARRRKTCQAWIVRLYPDAAGLLLFSRINIYYLTGTVANGVLWLPREGEAVLMVRKGEERCRLESPLRYILPFSSYSELPKCCASCGVALEGLIAAEMAALPWSLAEMLQARLPGVRFTDASQIPVRLRAVKTSWELDILRRAGERLRQVLREDFPKNLRVDMTEREIAHLLWEKLFAHGHGGILRSGVPGAEAFGSIIAAGASACYPGLQRRPLGFRGEHCAMPFMGYAGSVWRSGQLLALDTAFMLEGYQPQMGISCWSGRTIPDRLRRAQDCCTEIFLTALHALTPGNSPAAIWHEACRQAARAGFAKEFSGGNTNQVTGLGQGTGLGLYEAPLLGEAEEGLLEENMVIVLEPRIILPDLGAAGFAHSCVVRPEGGISLTGEDTDVIFLPERR